MARDIEYILVLCEYGGQKTHVAFRRNLNSKQIRRYLDFLLESRMLEVDRASNLQAL